MLTDRQTKRHRCRLVAACSTNAASVDRSSDRGKANDWTMEQPLLAGPRRLYIHLILPGIRCNTMLRDFDTRDRSPIDERMSSRCPTGASVSAALRRSVSDRGKTLPCPPRSRGPSVANVSGRSGLLRTCRPDDLSTGWYRLYAHRRR